MRIVRADLSEGNFDFARWTEKIRKVVEDLEGLGFDHKYRESYSPEEHIQHLREINRPQGENMVVTEFFVTYRTRRWTS